MKRELRKQFNKMKRNLKPSSKLQDAFNEMFILMELVVSHVDESIKQKRVKKDKPRSC